MAKIFKGDGFPIAAQKIARNKPCWCGSGKKAKNCCGAETRYFSTNPDDKPTHEGKVE